MNNKIIAGVVVGSALLIGFAAGRFTASSDSIVRDAGDKSANKTKLATMKRTGAYHVPHAESAANAAAPETPAEQPAPNGRGKGKFDPAAFAATARVVEELGRFDLIDINAGCPVRKIMNRGDGAGLLRDLPPFPGPKVIYGETSRLGRDRLKTEGITFKQIPYDIKAR